MNDSILYVYGIVRAGFDAARAPAGLDDSRLRLATNGRVAALTSQLSASEYGSGIVERNSAEVAWLSPKAMAHDRVLTWAQEHGGVIPLPMFSMWQTEASLTRSLGEQASQLESVFERVAEADEFGLRLHRRDAVMLTAIDELDPGIGRLREEARAAAPGQRYLLERKIGEQSKGALRMASQRMAREVFERLRGIARESLSRPLVPETAAGIGVGVGGAAEATLVLNGAFLVDRRRLDDFRAAVGSLVREFEPRGLSFDFTGPWPPYNFVASDGGSAFRGEGAR